MLIRLHFAAAREQVIDCRRGGTPSSARAQQPAEGRGRLGNSAFGARARDLDAALRTVIYEDNNVYVGAVNIASRISGLSVPGDVLVSETVRSLTRTSAGVRFEDRGEGEMKAVGEKVRVCAVRGEEA